MTDFGDVIASAKDQRHKIDSLKNSGILDMLKQIHNMFEKQAEYIITYNVPQEYRGLADRLVDELTKYGYTIIGFTDSSDCFPIEIKISCKDS
jgi:hypothetical protein